MSKDRDFSLLLRVRRCFKSYAVTPGKVEALLLPWFIWLINCGLWLSLIPAELVVSPTSEIRVAGGLFLDGDGKTIETAAT